MRFQRLLQLLLCASITQLGHWCFSRICGSQYAVFFLSFWAEFSVWPRALHAAHVSLCFVLFSDRVFINSGPCFFEIKLWPLFRSPLSETREPDPAGWTFFFGWEWVTDLYPAFCCWYQLSQKRRALRLSPEMILFCYPGSSNMDNEVMVPSSCDEHGFSVCCILFNYDLVCQQEAVAVWIVSVELFKGISKRLTKWVDFYKIWWVSPNWPLQQTRYIAS
jgi:hypothetical protein